MAGWVAITNTGDSPPPPPDGMTATGGLISDYQDGGDYYRAHIFTGTGTFEITALSPNTPFNELDYLVVAGGGGGGVGGDETITQYQARWWWRWCWWIEIIRPNYACAIKGIYNHWSSRKLCCNCWCWWNGGFGNLGPSGRKAGQLGSDSSWAFGGTITSTGGGAGQGAPGRLRADGGSGGGGEGWAPPTNVTLPGGTGPGEGNPGGDGQPPDSSPDSRNGGGGGGAGGAGNPGSIPLHQNQPEV